MTAGARLERRGDVALIALDNPPVNGLAHGVRQGIVETLETAGDDGAIQAIVLIGDGKLFSGGADIREFNTPSAAASPTLREVIERVEACAKPVIAAMHGGAYGGGLELAMACHYRIASGSAKLALPEVKLGLLPGAGGTQRLPRLVGARAALAMIVSGEAIDGRRALQLGLLDEIADGDLAAAAIAFAHRVTSASSHPVASRRAVASDGDPAIFAAARADAAHATPGFLAPVECIACVEASGEMPFEAGLRFERGRFDRLLNDPQSRAMRYLFFAERQAAKTVSAPGAAALAALGGVAGAQPATLDAEIIAAVARLAAKVGPTAAVVAICRDAPGRRLLLRARREAASLAAAGAASKTIAAALDEFGIAPSAVLAGDAPRGLPDVPPTAVSEMRPRAVNPTDVIERIVFALVDEGARLLEDGSVERASDIDLVCVHGFGFPPWRGGPMFYADASGLEQVQARMQALHRAHGDRWTPAPRLARLAATGGRFTQR